MYIKISMPYFNSLLVFTMKMKAEYRFYPTAILLYTIQKSNLYKVAYSSNINHYAKPYSSSKSENFKATNINAIINVKVFGICMCVIPNSKFH